MDAFATKENSDEAYEAADGGYYLAEERKRHPAN